MSAGFNPKLIIINLRYHFADPLDDTEMIQRNLLYNVFARPGAVSEEQNNFQSRDIL